MTVLPRGIRTKFFLYSNILIVVSISLATAVAVQHERTARYDAIVARGQSMTEVLSIPVTDALMYQELGLISEEGLIDAYVAEVLERNRDLVRYVVVTDPAGRVTHSNRWELLGRHYDRALSREQASRPSVSEARALETGEAELEIRTALHVSTRFWGTLVMGFSLSTIQEEVRTIERNAVLIALTLILVNSLLTALYVESLIRPIFQLNRTMKEASRGDLTVRAEERRGDEVAELGRAFNGMMAELQQARRREELQRAQLAEADKMVAVGTLAAGVAHEVNNPLAGILTCLDMVEASPEDAEARKRYLELVRGGIRRIEHTVTNLLDFSRPRERERRLTSMDERIAHVLELVVYQVRKAKVDVRVEHGADGALVLADPFQMEQLLLNLVLNGIQAMPDGGTLALRTRRDGERVAVEIADTGVGIPAENRARVFEPFFTTRGVGQGTGLGLSVSYGIVRAHGGTIELESEPGRGTTFRVVLPAAAADAGEERA